ncbi:hypothetical protein BC629DRAFT_449414 [Irpex lacteus]|nr:hypothetical protein BC629DRAFT_449414 [Irpex lacteus]
MNQNHPNPSLSNSRQNRHLRVKSVGRDSCYKKLRPMSHPSVSELNLAHPLLVHAPSTYAVGAQAALAPTLTLIPTPRESPPVHRRYSNATPIQFYRLSDGQLGIRLSDFLEGTGNSFDLIDDGTEVMSSLGVKISYKIEWPGYQVMRKQVYSRRVHGVQCRTRIAKQVAQMVDDFVHVCDFYIGLDMQYLVRLLENMLQEKASCAPSSSEWRVGSGFISYERIYLIGLKQISKSTWVVVLAYASQT